MAVRLKEQWIRVRTLRLNADWQDVHAELLGLIEDKSHEAAPREAVLVS